MNTAIIGAGLMCKRRAPVLINSKNSELKVIASKDFSDAKAMAKNLVARPQKIGRMLFQEKI